VGRINQLMQLLVGICQLGHTSHRHTLSSVCIVTQDGFVWVDIGSSMGGRNLGRGRLATQLTAAVKLSIRGDPMISGARRMTRRPQLCMLSSRQPAGSTTPAVGRNCVLRQTLTAVTLSTHDLLGVSQLLLQLGHTLSGHIQPDLPHSQAGRRIAGRPAHRLGVGW
jgi:hypothetical protein